MIFLGILALLIFSACTIGLFFIGVCLADDGVWWGFIIPLVGIPLVCQVAYWLLKWVDKIIP